MSFTLADLPAGLVAAALAAEHGIGVRDGRFCAHPLVDRLTGGSGAVRASLGLRTAAHDVQRLVGALGDLARRGAVVDLRPVRRALGPDAGPAHTGSGLTPPGRDNCRPVTSR